jgi:uncharacterized membrane protein
MTRLLRADVIALAVVSAILVVLAWVAPRGFHIDVRQAQSPTFDGTVVRVVSDNTTTTAQGVARTRVLEVATQGKTVTVQEVTTPGGAQLVPPQPGDHVLLQSSTGAGGEAIYYIVDRGRSGLLIAIAVLFVALVLFVGRWYGLRSLLGLGATYLILMRFVVPGILSGHSPLAISLVGGVGIMASTLVLAHGADRKSAAAVGGTALALVLIIVLSQVSIAAAKFTGLADDNAATVFQLFGGTIDARGLLLAGILIGALGALDDVTMTQSSTVFELREANPALDAWSLYARGMRVGRDHIAAIVNTLVLAYAGAALPLLMILASQSEGLGTLLNREFLATEVVRTIVGSIGIVAAVPLTTALAAFVAGSGRFDRGADDEDDDGESPPAPPYGPIESLDTEDLLSLIRPRRPQI